MWIASVVTARVDMDMDVVQVGDGVHELVTDGFGDVVAAANGEVFIDDDGEGRRQPMADPAHANVVDASHPGDVPGGVFDGVDERGIDGVHETVEDLPGGAAEHSENGDGDGEPDDRVGTLEAHPGPDGAEGHG